MMKMNKRFGAFLLVILMFVTAMIGCANIEEGEIDWKPNGKDPAIESQPTAAPEKIVTFGAYPSAAADAAVSGILKTYVRIDPDTGVWTEYEKTVAVHYDLSTRLYTYTETINGQSTEKQYVTNDNKYFLVGALADAAVSNLLKNVQKDPATVAGATYDGTTETNGKTVAASYNAQSGLYNYEETVNGKVTVNKKYVEKDGQYFLIDSSALAGKSEIAELLNKLDPNKGIIKDENSVAARYDLQTGFYNYKETLNDQVIVEKQYVEENGKYFSVDPISWIILEEKADSYVLIAKDILDTGFPFLETFGTSTWADSSIRDWLNGTDSYAKGGTDYSTKWNFMNRAFTNAQIAMIKTSTLVTKDNASYGVAGGGETKDQIYLLSAEEVAAYFGETLTAQSVGTPYALHKGLSAKKDQGIWWLRSPGYNTSFQGIDRNGDVTSYGSADVTVGVRPVICVSKQAIS